MCPSSDVESGFAEEVLRKLLQRIEESNTQGQGPYLVSHTWTAGTKIYLVYTAPPSDRGRSRHRRCVD